MGDPLTLVAAAIGALLVVGGVWYFWSSAKRAKRHQKVWDRTQRLGLTEPVSLHPKIREDVCICTGACVEVCPEKDVLGMIDGKPKLINPTACIGHGECLRACPVEAIDLVIGTEKRGVDIPLLADPGFQTNVPGLYIAGELGGMGLIHNAINQGQQAMRAIAKSNPPRTPGIHQVLIVGAGPAGIAGALQAKEAGLDFAVVDQEQMGGALRSYPRQKVVMTAHAHLPLFGKVKLTRTTKEALLELWESVSKNTGLTVEEGVKVQEIKREEDGTFSIATSTGARRSQRVLLAIGRRGSPRKLGVPGEELPKVTYRLLEPEQYRGARCLVVGGGDSAIETALALSREPGTPVTLCYRGEKFDRIKPANHDLIEEARGAGKVDVRMKTTPTVITAADVTLGGAGEGTIANEWVFVCIGGELPTAWLAKMGVAVKRMHGEAHPALGGR
ncbi:MAG: FAD-binding protein [Myxococcales bacterium]|nr:FAD-binding protein [Myxococcales bacterium]